MFAKVSLLLFSSFSSQILFAEQRMGEMGQQLGCHQSSQCWWWWMALCLLAWVLISAGLVFLTWNKVICHIWKLKTLNYWQALLLCLSMAVLCAPRHFEKRFASRHGGSCHKEMMGAHHKGDKNSCDHEKEGMMMEMKEMETKEDSQN